MESLISMALGIGLAAAAGFRVFVPLFALSLASYFNVWPLNEQWQWLASPFALMILAAACIAEALAYLIPWFDNLLDTLAEMLGQIPHVDARLSRNIRKWHDQLIFERNRMLPLSDKADRLVHNSK